MNLAGAVASFVVIFLLMIGGTLWLRFRGALVPAHAKVVSAVITEGVLPAMIFCYVARAAEQAAFAELAAVIALAEFVALALSAFVGRILMRLDRRSLGSFMLASSFGSTSLIGNALLDVVFHGSAAVLGMGMVIGQFGVGVPNNTVGLWIGMRAGADGGAVPASRNTSDRLAVLKTPVIVAVLAGIVWSLSGIPTTLPGISAVFGALTLIGAALPFLAAAVTGLSLTHTDWRRLMPLIGLSQVLQLVAKPLFVLLMLSAMSLPNIDREVTLLLAALPASPLAAAFASRFGGDTELASTLVVSSTVLSVVTLPFIAWIA